MHQQLTKTKLQPLFVCIQSKHLLVELLELDVDVVPDLTFELIQYLLVIGSALAKEMRLMLGHAPQVNLALKHLL